MLGSGEELPEDGGEKFRVPHQSFGFAVWWWGGFEGHRTGLSAETESAQNTLATVVKRAGELELCLFISCFLLAVHP